eukprot:scaffold15548_cov31-Tisochrysis_lutea.AAC.4
MCPSLKTERHCSSVHLPVSATPRCRRGAAQLGNNDKLRSGHAVLESVGACLLELQAKDGGVQSDDGWPRHANLDVAVRGAHCRAEQLRQVGWHEPRD